MIYPEHEEWKNKVFQLAKEKGLVFDNVSEKRMMNSFWNANRTPEEVILFHLASKHSMHNHQIIKSGSKCGCYYCLKIFHPSKVENWTDGDKTTLCPYCNTDSVFVKIPGYPITHKFLNKLNRLAFSSIIWAFDY